ncbi:phosphate transport system substrate-binding protein [Novosphingobium kunmingense]|uniref:Phosphate transport system substrate-binding protein n=1 Tax=Novosphingobium kunmingense TaxID=1211806 RepID=A0A2N0HJC0_9SPHN|nr:substrate-binding domain-containing protein [Novosphingobium kunmingense]PKB19029.1 phosphate transport system substrate-binding protein [Novosphingobium kunmingense]
MIRLCLISLVLCAGAASAQPPKVGSMNSLDLQNARAEALKTKGQRRAYTKEFDLSGLPEYRPAAPMRGVIRQWGSNYLADSPLEGYFEEAFRKYHPEVRFENNLASTFIGMAGLYTGQADLAPMGRRPSWEELQAYQRMMGTLPAEIMMATGSFDVSGWSFALVPFVHKDNPIQRLTIEQLDGIFGAERQGGWNLNSWDASVARGPEKNIRTWGQLGLKGEWADKPIRVLGYTLNFHFPRDFAEKVMGGGYKWNEKLIEYSNKVREGEGDFGKLWNAGDQMMDDLGTDRYAITYTAMLYRDKPNVKTVPLARTAAGPYLMPTLETVQARTYPLTREVYFYANRKPGERLDPLVAEYLRFVVSREGQALVMKDGKYLPLTAAAARAQLVEIDKLGAAATGEGG